VFWNVVPIPLTQVFPREVCLIAYGGKHAFSSTVLCNNLKLSLLPVLECSSNAISQKQSCDSNPPAGMQGFHTLPINCLA